MFEKEIKVVLAKRGLKTSDVYKAIGIDKVVFYQAIRTSNLNNKTLNKILDYLELKLSVSIQEKSNDDSTI